MKARGVIAHLHECVAGRFGSSGMANARDGIGVSARFSTVALSPCRETPNASRAAPTDFTTLPTAYHSAGGPGGRDACNKAAR